MTLVELLAAIGILGIVAFALTESIILGLRTTDDTAATISGSVATQNIASFFTGDVQSSETVATDDAVCAPDPVFIRFSWTDEEARTVSYSLDPTLGTDHDLVRWSCVGAAPPERKILGRFSRGTEADPLPVAFSCSPSPCVPMATAPRQVTLTVIQRPGSPPEQLTIARRTA